MRSVEEVEEFFESELLPEARGQSKRIAEPLARRAAASLPLSTKLAIVAAGVMLDIVIGSGMNATWLAIAVALFAGKWRARDLPEVPVYDVKQELIGRLVRFLDPNLTYEARGIVPEEIFRKSGLSQVAYDRYRGEDRIHGKLGATHFDLSEVRIDKQFGDKTKRLFGGLFFVADFNKEFRSRTYLFPDVGEKHLGFVARALQGVVHGDWRGELVHLENPEFERLFRVHSSDPTEARYLLSPSMMRRLREFRENLNAPLTLSFADGRIHMLIEHPQNLLEHVDVEHVDAPVLRRWLGEILFAVGLVEELDLNTRIWSKDPEARVAEREEPPGTPERPRINPAARLSSERGTELRESAPLRSLLRNAFAGNIPLWQAVLVFGFGGSMVLGQAPVLLAKMGASSPAAFPIVSMITMLPIMFILWRNAPNTGNAIWGTFTRIGVGFSLLSVLTTIVLLVLAMMGVVTDISVS